MTADGQDGHDEAASRPPDAAARPRAPGMADAAGRMALFPARVAARRWRHQLEGAAEEVLATPEIERLVDRALAGPLPEAVVRSLARHQVVERMGAELAETGEVDRLLRRLLASDEMRRALTTVVTSAEVRAMVRQETGGVVEEVFEDVRASTIRLDERVAQAVRRDRAEARGPYAGLASRAVALAADVVLLAAVTLSAVGIVALVASLAGGLSNRISGFLLGGAWVIVAFAYFTLSWAAGGQTIGMRFLGLRVQTGTGEPPSGPRSFARMVGLVLSIAPAFAGFIPVLFDSRRRSLADFIAGTTVVYDESPTA